MKEPKKTFEKAHAPVLALINASSQKIATSSEEVVQPGRESSWDSCDTNRCWT